MPDRGIAMAEPILPPLKPMPMKDRVSVMFVEKGQLDVLDGASSPHPRG
jgi:CRISPR-associated protein Cas1